MIGYIVSYDAENGQGVLNNGSQMLGFTREHWQYPEPPYVGCPVSVTLEQGMLRRVEVLGKYNPPSGDAVKSRRIAGLLGLLFGGLGVHRFYLGYYKLGVMQLLVTAATLGFGYFWGIIDGLLILNARIGRDAHNRPLK